MELNAIMTCNPSHRNIWQNDPLCRGESAFDRIRVSRWIGHYWWRTYDLRLLWRSAASPEMAPLTLLQPSFYSLHDSNRMRYVCVQEISSLGNNQMSDSHVALLQCPLLHSVWLTGYVPKDSASCIYFSKKPTCHHIFRNSACRVGQNCLWYLKSYHSFSLAAFVSHSLCLTSFTAKSYSFVLSCHFHTRSTLQFLLENVSTSVFFFCTCSHVHRSLWSTANNQKKITCWKDQMLFDTSRIEKVGQQKRLHFLEFLFPSMVTTSIFFVSFFLKQHAQAATELVRTHPLLTRWRRINFGPVRMENTTTSLVAKHAQQMRTTQTEHQSVWRCTDSTHFRSYTVPVFV